MFPKIIIFNVHQHIRVSPVPFYSTFSVNDVGVDEGCVLLVDLKNCLINLFDEITFFKNVYKLNLPMR